MLSSPLPFVLLAMACSAGGWAAGHFLRKSTDSAPAITPTVAPKRSQPPKVSAHASTLTNTDKRPDKTEALSSRHAFIDGVSRGSQDSMEQMFKGAMSIPSPTERRIRREILALRWVELGAAAEEIERNLKTDIEFAQSLMASWCRVDMAAFKNWADSQPNALANQATRIIAENAAKFAGESLFQELNESKILRAESITQRTQILESMVETNRPRALELIEKSDLEIRHSLCNAVAGRWALTDLPGAMEWAKSRPHPKSRAHAMMAVLRVQAKIDPQGALKILETLPPDNDVAGGTPHGMIAAEWAKSEPKAAADWIKKLDPNKHSQEEMLVNAVLPHLPDLNAKAITEVFAGLAVNDRVNELKTPELVLPGLLRTLINWNPENPAAVFGELNSLPSSEAKSSLANYLAWRISSANPTEALSMAESATGTEKERLVYHAGAAAAQRGDTAALAKSLAMTEPENQMANASRQVEQLLQSHPDKAAEYLTILPENLRGYSATRMAENLALHNPVAALALAQNLLPEAQQQIVFSATRSWATADPIGAGRWVDTLAPGPAKEKAISGVSTGLYQTDPGGAFRWAAKLSDPAELVHHLQATYHEWLFSDAPGARAALMAAGLSPEQIKAVQTDPNEDSPETREKNELAIPLDGGIPSPTPNPK